MTQQILSPFMLKEIEKIMANGSDKVPKSSTTARREKSISSICIALNRKDGEGIKWSCITDAKQKDAVRGDIKNVPSWDRPQLSPVTLGSGTSRYRRMKPNYRRLGWDSNWELSAASWFHEWIQFRNSCSGRIQTSAWPQVNKIKE